MYKSPFLSNIYDEMMRRRYAKRTIETYLHWIKALLFSIANNILHYWIMHR